MLRKRRPVLRHYTVSWSPPSFVEPVEAVDEDAALAAAGDAIRGRLERFESLGSWLVSGGEPVAEAEGAVRPSEGS